MSWTNKCNFFVCLENKTEFYWSSVWFLRMFDIYLFTFLNPLWFIYSPAVIYVMVLIFFLFYYFRLTNALRKFCWIILFFLFASHRDENVWTTKKAQFGRSIFFRCLHFSLFKIIINDEIDNTTEQLFLYFITLDG